ncbi:MAG: hypothetical protein WAV38_07795 [Xanthobacteraceae bacterium]
MPLWREPSIDEMLADPTVCELMAADRVSPEQVKALLRSVHEAAERHSSVRHGSVRHGAARADQKPHALACLAAFFGATSHPSPMPNRAEPTLRPSRIGLADYSSLSILPLGSTLPGDPKFPVRS